MDNKLLSSSNKSFSEDTFEKKSFTTDHFERHRNKKAYTNSNSSRIDYDSKIKFHKPSDKNHSDHSSNKHVHATGSTSHSQHNQKIDRILSKKDNAVTKITGANAMPSSAIRYRSKRLLQNFLLVWLDTDIDETNEDFLKSLVELRKIVISLYTFTNATECLEYIKSITEEKILLIISGSLGQKMVPLIHDMVQLDTIFIFCKNEDYHRLWAKQWSKVEGIYSTILFICKHLKKVTRECDHDTIPMSFVSKDVISTATSHDRNLNQLPPEYMYSVLFKEILLEIEEEDTKPMNDLINYCRDQDIPKSELDYFQCEYNSKSPIWLYSSEIFLYSMLNKALRSLDMEVMAKLGFFIRRLHRQLEQLHQKQVAYFTSEFTVYRGQGLACQDFGQLINNKGGLISFHSFLSTSKKENIAIQFIQHAIYKNKGCVGVLFVMKIDPKKISTLATPFAFIDDESALSQKEEEILFTMHTVFRVIGIKQRFENNRLHEVQLTMTGDNDPDMYTLTKRFREEFNCNGWYRMGQLMLALRHFSQAEELYNELLASAANDSERAEIYYRLGMLKFGQGKYQEAVKLSEKSIAIKLKNLSEDDISLANTYNNIGAAYNNLGDYDKTLHNYERARKIKEKSLSPDDPDLALAYNNIGQVHNSMGDYSKALDFYKKSLKISEEVLPANHPSLADSYNNIGATYYARGDYSKAFEFYEKAIKISEKALPSNHPDLAISYNNIGQVYNNMGNYMKAFEFYEKSLKIRKKALPPNHPDLAISYNNIAAVHNSMGDYAKALEFYEKSLKIYEKALPSNHPWLATSYGNIGETYNSMGDYSKALQSHEKSLKIKENALPFTHPDLAISYNNIGLVYSNLGDHLRALEFYEKSLKIRKKNLPPTHPDLATSYNNIGLVHKSMSNYSKALEFYEKSLEIDRKTRPSNHPDLATSYNNIGTTYYGKGDYPKALQYLENALAIFQNSLPATHPNIRSVKQSIEFIKKEM